MGHSAPPAARSVSPASSRILSLAAPALAMCTAFSAHGQRGLPGSIGHDIYLHVKIIDARLGRRIQYGNDRRSPVVGIVEGLPGASLPRRATHPFAGSRLLRFCL